MQNGKRRQDRLRYEQLSDELAAVRRQIDDLRWREVEILAERIGIFGELERIKEEGR